MLSRMVIGISVVVRDTVINETPTSEETARSSDRTPLSLSEADRIGSSAGADRLTPYLEAVWG